MSADLNHRTQRFAATAQQKWRRILQRAATHAQRMEAIRIAISMGVPLREIEDHIDHLEVMGPAAEIERQD